MPYIYSITSDERIKMLFYEFDKASKDAFEGDDKHRFEAILVAHEFRKQLLERLTELQESEKPRLIDSQIIDNNDNDQTLIGRLAALMLDKTSFNEFIMNKRDKLSKEMKSLFINIEHNTKVHEHVLIWLVSEDDLDGII